MRFLLIAALLLAGCTGNPAVGIFVLSPVASAPAARPGGPGAPVLQVLGVTVPDYLDTTDILLRIGPNQLKPSATGRWGERLSKGLTGALATGLGRRLPAYAVTAVVPADTPARQVAVDVEAVDIHPDGRCVVVARWTVLSGDGRTTQTSGRDSFTVPGSGSAADAAVVANLTAALDQLADSVAAAAQQR